MSVCQEHGLGKYLAILRHVDPDSDDGLGDIHDFVHAQYDTQGLEQPLQFLIDFIGNEADADATFDAVAQPVIDGAYAGRSCSWDLFIGPVHRIGFLIISSGKLPII